MKPGPEWKADPHRPGYLRDPHRPGYLRDGEGRWYEEATIDRLAHQVDGATDWKAVEQLEIVQDLQRFLDERARP